MNEKRRRSICIIMKIYFGVVGALRKYTGIPFYLIDRDEKKKVKRYEKTKEERCLIRVIF